MSDFLEYFKTTAIYSLNAHKHVHGTSKRVILSRVDHIIVLCSNDSAHNLTTALEKYNDIYEDMEITVERLVCID